MVPSPEGIHDSDALIPLHEGGIVQGKQVEPGLQTGFCHAGLTNRSETQDPPQQLHDV